MNSLRAWIGAERGAVARTAQNLGVPQPLLSQWLTGARDVPCDRCPAIERATEGRVTVDQLRPDVRWARIADPTWPHPGGRPTIDVAGPASAEVE